MTTFGARVRIARKAKGWSEEKLAQAVGIKQSSIHQMETDGRETSKHARKIAQATGVRIEWLETGEEPMELEPAPAQTLQTPNPSDSEPINIKQWERNLPVLGSAICGEDGLFDLNGQTLDYVRRPPRLIGVKGSYALYTAGDCMAPWREHGDLVYVTPHLPVKINDYVVVQLKPENDGDGVPAYIKRLVRRTEKELRLLQYNPRKELTIPTRRILAIHKIMDWSELVSM